MIRNNLRDYLYYRKNGDITKSKKLQTIRDNKLAFNYIFVSLLCVRIRERQTCTIACLWRSGNNFMKLVLSFHLNVGAGVEHRSPGLAAFDFIHWSSLRLKLSP